MKRTILTGLLALAACASVLMAQQKGQAGPKQPQPKSKAEFDAVSAMFQAAQGGNSDDVIKNGNELITKFADTDFKDTALYLMAEAYQKKRDSAKAEIYAEQSLAANPKSYQASILLSEIIVQGTRENDLDREEKLGKAEKYAKDAMEIVKDVPKPNPQVTDDQWAEFRKSIAGKGHNAMGLAALVRKKYDVAAAEFKAAVENDPQEPAYMVRQASALQSGGKNNEAIAICDKIIADPQAHPQIKQVAQQIRDGAIKAGGKPGGGE
jgi:tetratricopeptide (TPR) repeat protein